MSVRSQVMQTLSDQGAQCGACGTEPGMFRDCPECVDTLSHYADALDGAGLLRAPCAHCHNDPPRGHACPACGLKARS